MALEVLQQLLLLACYTSSR